MNVFDVHKSVVSDYQEYIESFISIADLEIKEAVDKELANGKLWPEPLLQFNPAYKSAGLVSDLCADGKLQPQLGNVLQGYSLYQHQYEAIKLGTAGRDFVVTSGTGSGKSLTYIGSIFSHLLANPDAKGVVAVVVYPLNALINSQTEEFEKYRKAYEKSGKTFPISYGQYTGQEDEHKRLEMRSNPPQILLTNYMMLELLLTRSKERPIRDAIYKNLQFLVFDEMHTYRGRQGSDVAMLIRRIRAKTNTNPVCIGTSATMASGGSLWDQRTAVANVASTLFGKVLSPEQVVNETLDRSLHGLSSSLSQELLHRAVVEKLPESIEREDLAKHPVAIWLEDKAALDVLDGTLIRRKPRPISAIAKDLALDAGTTEEQARTSIESVLLWISTINEALQKQNRRDTVLPFRLHQFVSQTGSVYTTLDQDENRFITLEPGLYKADDANKKPIFANVFSRNSGHAFVCVTKTKEKLYPREFIVTDSDEEQDPDKTDGYLIYGDDIWNPVEDLDLLPDTWFNNNKKGRIVKRDYENRIPQRIHTHPDGSYTEYGPGDACWFMPAPLLFDPTSGTFFDGQREGTKLAKLGSEGRSTSTTIAAYSFLKQLRKAEYKLVDQKLMSFTDNRQDAALQAGHFNDFVQVVQLRSAIYKAVQQAGEAGLTITTIGPATRNALGLQVSDFARTNSDNLAPFLQKPYIEWFERYLQYKVLSDLRRSWRIVLPNLEQCALLSVDYEFIDQACEDNLWSDVPGINSMTFDKRKSFIRAILDYFRMEFALEHPDLLDEASIKTAAGEIRSRLKAPWSLDKGEFLPSPTFMRTESLANNRKIDAQSLGPSSGVGKFIKYTFQNLGAIEVVKTKDAYDIFIKQLLRKLVEYDFLMTTELKNSNSQATTVYRLKANKLIWKVGDGINAQRDVIKKRSYKSEATDRPNKFFLGMYQTGLESDKVLRAADHTGQLNYDQRKDREDKFRCDGKEWRINLDPNGKPDEAKIARESISALFCSPTMELGIDIGGLSVVHMRNAPPNPANYAQRSGRAGRSGQGAVVFTYCSSFSAHDQHYFSNQADLVAGAVEPPRIDLVNQELLLTHLHALTISEIGLPGLDNDGGTQASVAAMVDLDDPAKPLLESIKLALEITPSKRVEILSTFKRVIGDISNVLDERASKWFTSEWSERSLNNLTRDLDSSFGRWRSLYESAETSNKEALAELGQNLHTATSERYKALQNIVNQAQRQIDLLKNQTKNTSSELSEFYPYRYLAAEGFLPGYNFTRLPIRVFIPNSDGYGEFLSRPRSIALREFGPLNIIYHNGRKYRVQSMRLRDVDQATTKAKVCNKSGYFLSGDEFNLELCPFSNIDLSDSANVEYFTGLVEMSESRATEIERISCEEEERVRKGYEISTYFSTDGSQTDVQKAIVKTGDTELMNVKFIPAARIVSVNNGWRATKQKQFPYIVESGEWKSAEHNPDDDDRQFETRRISLWTSETADAIYLEPVFSLGLDGNGVITLMYALKRAIELEFQVEQSELGVFALGTEPSLNIFLYESAEGSLGILRQFVDRPDVLQKVAKRAIEVCRFSDEDYKAPASYGDLLSYYNQRDHAKLDRELIKDALDQLSNSNVEILTNSDFDSYDSHYEYLIRSLDANSSTERKFVDYLYQNKLRLPDETQQRVEGIYCQPDFVYDNSIYVFCDGTPHDLPAVKADDQKKRQALVDAGYEVIVYYYKDSLSDLVRERPDVFRSVK